MKRGWKIEGRLGEGGMGEVYRALTPKGERVALKVLAIPQPFYLKQFEEEAILLLRLRHPSLVPVLGYELKSEKIFGEDKGPCFWMEFVEGEDLITAAKNVGAGILPPLMGHRGGAGGSPPLQVFEWLRQALEALQYLHSQSILHGDISPNNVLIDKKGRLRLLDFGLAGAEGISFDRTAGTLLYMASEKVDGVQSQAGDLFSLGTLFYEALAGQHPREGCTSLRELAKCEAAPLLQVRPDLTAEFSVPARVIDRMIQINLSERFGRAEEALEALSGGKTAPASVSEYHPATMLGAEEAFQAVKQGLSQLSSRSALFALHGITGVGKKRFLRELAFQAAILGVSLSEVNPAQWKEGLAELSRKDSLSPRAYLFRSLEALSLNELSPLFRLLREGIPEKGAFLLFEWNDDLLNEETERFFQSLLRTADIQGIHLKNLSRQNTFEMVKGGLGEGAAEEISEALFDQTGGNPLMLLKLIDLLRAKQIASKKHFSKDWLENLRNFHSFEDILLSRLEGLAKGEKEILLFLAAAGEPVGLESLASAARVSAQDLKSTLHRLVSRELVKHEVSHHRYSLSTPALGDALLKSVEDARKQSIHRAWLNTLKGEDEAHPQKIHHALALKEGGLIQAGARRLAESLLKQGKLHEALLLVDSSLPLLTDPVETSRFLRIKINAQNLMRRFEEALATYDQVLALAAPDEPLPLKSVKYWLTTGRIYQNLGQDVEAERRLKQCVLEGEKNYEASLAPFLIHAYSLLGRNEIERKNFSAAKSYFEKGLQLAGSKGSRRAEVLRNLALVLSKEKDWERAKALLAEARTLYQESHYHPGEFYAWLDEGILAKENDDPDRAEHCNVEAERVALRHEDDLLLALVWNNQGVLAAERGQLSRGLDRLDRALEIFRPLGSPLHLAENLMNHAKVLAALGRFSSSSEDVAEIRRIESSDPQAAVFTREAEAFLLELKEGKFDPSSPVEVSDSSKALSLWNKEKALRRLTREGKRVEPIRDMLMEIFLDLPLNLKVSFADRWDFKKWVQPMNPPMSDSPQPKEGENVMNILESLSSLNKELLREENMDLVLRHLMDAAMQLSKAESGFLVLRSDTEGGPLPGFRVAIAKNVAKEILSTEEYSFSFSAIRQAMETGEPVITDNALSDSRFVKAKSVHLRKLKSILALPVHGPRGILGVFYLDHRFESGLFNEEALAGLQAFVDLSALALQKFQMIEDLKKANQNLNKELEDTTDTMQQMKQELAENRIQLKNEYSEIVGRSPRMMKVLSLVDKITERKISVWIFGESGTGKESIARALHFNSSRAKFPFASENCSALPENLMESELFGHKRGAFTQADRDKKGILEYANKGTLFLDEVADLSLNTQAKLLRFLQEGEFRPLGSNEVVKVDVRVVSASNRDLHELVKEGKFREDLLFRLNGITVVLPPLRERMEDLKLLADHFLKKVAVEEKTKPCRIHPEALKILMRYSWPGNIRELQHTLETAQVFAEKGWIVAESLEFKPVLFAPKEEEPRAVSEPESRPIPQSAPSHKSVAVQAKGSELEKILMAIRDNGFHKGHAAEALGISRRNLYLKLEKYKVPVEARGLKAFIDDHLR
jgi:transcriptional regulator with GAF, ATPase, and Fis domain